MALDLQPRNSNPFSLCRAPRDPVEIRGAGPGLRANTGRWFSSPWLRTPPQPLLARRTWHGAGDAGFHPSVRAQRRGGSRAAQTFVPVDPGRVILSFPELLFFPPLYRSSVDRKNVSKKRENGRRSNRRGGDSRPDSSKIATAK